MLIFFSGYLNNLSLQVVHSSFYLLQLLLHPFTLTFVIPVYLVGDNLRVAMNNHTCDPYSLARSSPATSASYSASLLVEGKLRRTIHSILSPSGERSMMPGPPTYLLDDPSVCMLHRGHSFTPLSSSLVNSVMKSTTTYPLMAVCGRY